jgi:hypothetical protein
MNTGPQAPVADHDRVMARKSDSCLTPSIKGEAETCATGRYFGGRIQLSSGVYHRAVHFGLFRAASEVEAPVRVLLYGTGWRTRTAVTISGALAQDWIAQAAAR